MYSVRRIPERPPEVFRLPVILPESLLMGATPTSFATSFRLSVPSSGSSAMIVLTVTGPTPFTELRISILRVFVSFATIAVNGGGKVWRLAGEKCSARFVEGPRGSVVGGSRRGVNEAFRALC